MDRRKGSKNRTDHKAGGDHSSKVFLERKEEEKKEEEEKARRRQEFEAQMQAKRDGAAHVNIAHPLLSFCFFQLQIRKQSDDAMAIARNTKLPYLG